MNTLFNLKGYTPLKSIWTLNTRGLLGGLLDDVTSLIFYGCNAIREANVLMRVCLWVYFLIAIQKGL